MKEMDCSLVQMEWSPPRLSAFLPLVILPSNIKSRRKRAIKRLWCSTTTKKVVVVHHNIFMALLDITLLTGGGGSMWTFTYFTYSSGMGTTQAATCSLSAQHRKTASKVFWQRWVNNHKMSTVKENIFVGLFWWFIIFYWIPMTGELT